MSDQLTVGIDIERERERGELITWKNGHRYWKTFRQFGLNKDDQH